MNRFTPRPYQQDLIDVINRKRQSSEIVNYGTPRNPVWLTKNANFSPHNPGGFVQLEENQMQHGPTMIIDEAGEWPVYKWYRNPIKLYRWRRMMNQLMRRK